MSKSERYRTHWSLFLNEHNRKEFHPVCRKCYHECKQSRKVKTIDCSRYLSKRSEKHLEAMSEIKKIRPAPGE